MLRDLNIFASKLNREQHSNRRDSRHNFPVGDSSISAIDGLIPEEELDFSSKDDENQDESNDMNPGELLATTSKLVRIKEDINTCFAQLDAVDLLSWNLGNNPRTEIHTYLLEKTKELICNEIGELVKRKAKYESHEQREAIVPGQCNITIEEEHERHDSSEKSVTFYNIFIVKTESRPITWSVVRRYSDFNSLHSFLKRSFPFIQEFELPGKNLGALWPRAKTDQALRAKLLEKYLQRLVDNPETCQSVLLRNFLSSNFNSSESKRSKLFRLNERGRAIKNIDHSIKRQIAKISLIPKIKNQLSKDMKLQVKEFWDEKKKNWRQRKNRSSMDVPEIDPIDIKIEDMNPDLNLAYESSEHLGEDREDESLERLQFDEPYISDYSVNSVDDALSWSSSSDLDDEDKEVEEAGKSCNKSVENTYDFGPSLAITENPILTAIVELLLQLFDFREKSAYLRRTAAIMFLRKFSDRNLEMYG